MYCISTAKLAGFNFNVIASRAPLSLLAGGHPGRALRSLPTCLRRQAQAGGAGMRIRVIASARQAVVAI